MTFVSSFVARAPKLFLLAALTLGSSAAVTLGSRAARATPRPLPFTYPAETLPQGNLEVEQYVDLVPVRVAREEDAGTNAVTSLRSELQTELEYGITNKLELGMYFAFEQAASANAPYLQFQGIKQRIRYELSNQPCWPLGVGLYGEIAEFHDEIEFEEKILLSKRFGAIGVAANLWVEQEYYFQDDQWKFIYNPAMGGYYEFSPHISLGLEYWARGRFDKSAAEKSPEGYAGTRHYLGPTMLLQAGEYFTSLGTYLRMDHLSEPLAVGDPSGRVWIRLLIGVLL